MLESGFEPEVTLTENRRIFFQVLVKYIGDESGPQVLESVALETIGEADDIIQTTAENLSSKYPDSSIVMLEPGELTEDDQFHVIVKDGEKILAKLGIVATDYTAVTLH